MNEFFKNMMDKVKELWSKSTLVQKIILFGIIGGVILALILAVNFSAAPSRVPLIQVPITAEEDFRNISLELDKEGVSYTTSEDNMIYVQDHETARRMRTVIVQRGLMPQGTDPWAIFDMDRWTLTDFERDVNLRRAITGQLEQHILALEDVDDVNVNLVLPEDALFGADQNPVTASVRITPKPGSDISTNRTKISGIVRLIMLAVEGLQEENIVITDHTGVVLNNEDQLKEFDRLALGARELKYKQDLERDIKNDLLAELQAIFREDRVRILKVEAELDTDKMTTEREEFFPIEMTPEDPTTPYPDREVIISTPISRNSRDVEFVGSGWNPNGPPGSEGQTPAVYRDADNLVGEYRDNSNTENFAVNREVSNSEKSPLKIKKYAVSVAIDGLWNWVYDEEGEVQLEPSGAIVREYVPVPPERIREVDALIKGAIGYNQARGDLVEVRTIPFDRTAEHRAEDDELRSRRQFESFLLWSVVGLAIILVGFIVSRLVAKELERRRRLREEELSRQHQAMREAALRSAEEEGVDVEMSVAERARLEMQENAINMAREHPEEVAQLIRTWLAEDN
jgi:flagellar M-ring protein FliF